MGVQEFEKMAQVHFWT